MGARPEPQRSILSRPFSADQALRLLEARHLSAPLALLRHDRGGTAALRRDALRDCLLPRRLRPAAGPWLDGRPSAAVGALYRRPADRSVRHRAAAHRAEPWPPGTA